MLHSDEVDSGVQLVDVNMVACESATANDFAFGVVNGIRVVG